MSPYRFGLRPVLLAMMMTACAGACVLAGEPPSEQAMAKLGLKPVKTVLVLEADEAEVHTKIEAARQLARQWTNASMQQRSMLSEKEYQATVKELTAETNQFKSELNNANRMISQLPRWRNRFATNLAAEQDYELTVYKTQLQWEINQRTAFLNELKSQASDPKARLKLDGEVRDKGEAVHQAVQDLRQLVDATAAKYEKLREDEEVKKFLNQAEKKSGITLRLGPSHQFHLDVKLLERLETSLGEGGGSPSRQGRKTHRMTPGKRSSKAANGPGRSSSPS